MSDTNNIDAIPTDEARPWTAEQMLDALRTVDRSTSGASTTRDAIGAFFDRVGEPVLRLTSSSSAADSSRPIDAASGKASDSPSPRLGSQASARRSASGTAAGSASLPNVAPVSVPGHDLLRCIGAGGFGQVWIARHALTEHYRACKLIPLTKSLELDGLRHLKRRVQAHPGLFPIDDVGEAEGWLYVLMPLADNANSNTPVLDHTGYEAMTLFLYRSRAGGRLPAGEIAQIGAAIAEAIAHLHASGITHGDIKPMNIMRLAGRWTVGDYGLVRDLANPSGGGHTPGYIPPEGPGTTAADQYALGVVLAELATGLRAKAALELLAPASGRAAIEREAMPLREVILRATSNDPSSRYASVAELSAALEACHRPARANAARRLWALALVPVLALVIVALMWRPTTNTGATTAPPSGGAASAAVEVTSFKVLRYRYRADVGETSPLGPINEANPAAQFDDDVTVHATLGQPAYFFLLSLDTNGAVKLRLPNADDAAPQPASFLDYPSLPTHAGDLTYPLSDGPGVQGFMLLLSMKPLPPWNEWVARHGTPRWEPNPEEIKAPLEFDGHLLRIAIATRGEPRPVRGNLKLGPIEWARDIPEIETARLIAFPVLPKETK